MYICTYIYAYTFNMYKHTYECQTFVHAYIHTNICKYVCNVCMYVLCTFDVCHTFVGM